MVYIRDGHRGTATVTPGPSDKVLADSERESQSPTEREGAGDTPKAVVSEFGLEVQSLTADLARSLGLPPGTKGLLVSGVKDGSPADAAGIQQGDVITKVVRDHKPAPLANVKEFQNLASKTDELAVYVQRDKLGRFVVLSKSAK